MAIYDWVGADPGNEGDFDTAANWSPATVPVDGDTWRCRTGSQAITAGLDQSAKNFAQIYRGPGYSGNIGDGTNYLLCGATLLVDEGVGQMWIDASGTSFDINDIILRSASQSNRLFVKGTVGDCQVHRGLLTYESGTMTRLWQERIAAGQIDVLITAATVGSAFVQGGKLTLNSASGIVTDLYMRDGDAEILEGANTNFHGWGGRTIWKTATTCAAARLYSGSRFDASLDGRAKTFTLLETHVGCVGNFVNGPRNITVTTWQHLGGDVQVYGTAASPT